MKARRLYTAVKTLLFILLLFACKNSSNNQRVSQAERINIQFVDFDILTFVAINCDIFETAFSEEITRITVSDSAEIDYLNEIIKELEPIDSTYSNYIDTRAKMEIISPTDTSYICIGRLSLEKEGLLYKTPLKLLQFIEDLKSYILKFPPARRYL